MDLTVDFCGIRLRSPLLVSAGPLTRDADAIKGLAAVRGVGGVCMKTVYRESADTPRPCFVRSPGGLLNFDWSAPGLSKAVEELERLRDVQIPTIVSIYDSDPGYVAEMAAALEAHGAAAVEFPAGEGDLSAVRAVLRAIKHSSTMPVVIKGGPFFATDPGRWAREVEDSGADAIAAINSVGPGLLIDYRTGRPLLGNRYGHGYLTGPLLKPLALRAVAEMAKAVHIPILGGGGISTGVDALEMIMAGARCVFVHSVVVTKGQQVITKIVDEMEKLLQEKGCEALGDVRGVALQYLVDEVNMDGSAPTVKGDRCNGCGACVRSCVYGALRLEGKRLSVDSSCCFRCGLCESVCPTSAIELGLPWRREEE